MPGSYRRDWALVGGHQIEGIAWPIDTSVVSVDGRFGILTQQSVFRLDVANANELGSLIDVNDAQVWG